MTNNIRTTLYTVKQEGLKQKIPFSLQLLAFCRLILDFKGLLHHHAGPFTASLQPRLHLTKNAKLYTIYQTDASMMSFPGAG